MRSHPENITKYVELKIFRKNTTKQEILSSAGLNNNFVRKDIACAINFITKDRFKQSKRARKTYKILLTPSMK